MKALTGFFTLSLLASLLQYLFQVQLARALGQQAFTTFTAVWAQFGMLLVLAGVLQIWASLQRLSPERFRALWRLSNGVAIVFFALSLRASPPWLAPLASVLAAASLGLMLGYHLSHGRHSIMALAGVLGGCVKIGGLVFISANLPTYLWPLITISYLLPQVLHVFATSARAEPETGLGLKSAVCLALAVHFFPQADGLWAGNNREWLSTVAPLTLVTKAVFYFQLIFAQWWLPTQGADFQVRAGVVRGMAATAGLLTAGITLLGPQVLGVFLGWQNMPSPGLFFVASLQACLLALCFQSVQLSLLRKQTRLAWGQVSSLAIGWACIGELTTAPAQYYLLMSALLGVILGTWTRLRPGELTA
jgi:hypothetical protein